jgi:hypothetical protein
MTSWLLKGVLVHTALVCLPTGAGATPSTARSPANPIPTGPPAANPVVRSTPHDDTDRDRRPVTFRSDLFSFSVTYPGRYREVPVNSRTVALALRTEGTPFPTLNVVVQPRGYHPRSETRHVEDIVDDYRRVGFTDAKAVETTSIVTKAGILPWPGVEVAYSSGNRCLRSLVVIAQPARAFHYTITIIDTEEGFAQHRTEREEILRSFSYPTHPMATPDEGNYVSHAPLVLIVVLLGAIVAVAIVKIRSSPDHS